MADGCRLHSKSSFYNARSTRSIRSWFLLFLHQHTREDRISRDYVRQVTFTDAPALDEVIDELQDAGLLIANGEALSLRDAPGVRSDLNAMADVFEDPAGRQELAAKAVPA